MKPSRTCLAGVPLAIADGANTAGQTPSNPNMPAASPGARAPQPIQGQGTVKGSRANPPPDGSPPDGSPPGGRAGSGGHKSNPMGR